MRQIKLIVQYDGTSYCGWQIQPNGLSIQQVLEEGYSRLLKEPVRLTSSGRTDAGVHARGMVATFRTEKSLPMRAYVDGINTMIPPDISVVSAIEVPQDFHPRKDAAGKHYRYSILRSRVRNPLDRLYAWHFNRDLDLHAMQEGAGHFVGKRDFAAFCATNCAAKTTVRTIHSLDVIPDGDFLYVDVCGDGFLRNMVRIIAGTLVEVGLGKISPADVPLLFTGGQRADAGMTAPAHGLCLMEVYY